MKQWEKDQKRLVGLSDYFLPITRLARAPAGDSYSSKETITKDFESFARAYNSGLNDLHIRGIIARLQLEQEHKDIAASLGSYVIPNAVGRFWSHIANHLAWSAFQDNRHYLKQYWSGEKRPLLMYSNHQMVIPIMKQLADDGANLVVWTDATSFLSSGDLLVFDPLNKTRRVLEVKGVSRSEAFVMDHLVDEPALKELYKHIRDIDGESAAGKKVDRLRRQLKTAKQIESIVTNDEGFHPFYKKQVKLIEAQLSDEDFDEEIESGMSEARGVIPICGIQAFSLWFARSNLTL